MDKIIRILGLATLVFSLLTIVLWVIGMLWNTPNEGVVHNLCRISIISTSIFGSIFIFMFIKRESQDY